MRKDDIDRTLPDFLDVLAVVVSAGLGFRQALDRVAEKYEGPWADELRITLRQMDMGVSRRQAFDELRRRNDSEQVRHVRHRAPAGRGTGRADRRHPDPSPTTCAAPTRRTPAARRPEAVPKATMMITTFMVPATMILLGAGLFLGSGTDFGSILGR